MKKKKILILGVTGMLGNTLYTQFSQDKSLDVYGTVRDIKKSAKWFSKELNKKLYNGIHVEEFDTVRNLLKKTRPDIIINCIGIVKQSPMASDTQLQIYTNSLLPHKIAHECKKIQARFIHFSTDCVFSGKQGKYTESDQSDAEDIYGKTKYLGEVTGKNCITIRTSILGHGLQTHYSLIDWALLQSKSINGYTKVIYSGLPTIEIASILTEYIIPNKKLQGVYHIASSPISKYELLQHVCEQYNKKLIIKPDKKMVYDKSLITKRFFSQTGYKAPDWEILIKNMYDNYKLNPHFIRYA